MVHTYIYICVCGYSHCPLYIIFLRYTDMKYFNITVIQYIYDIFLTYRDRKIPKTTTLDPNKFEADNPWGVLFRRLQLKTVRGFGPSHTSLRWMNPPTTWMWRLWKPCPRRSWVGCRFQLVVVSRR